MIREPFVLRELNEFVGVLIAAMWTAMIEVRVIFIIWSSSNEKKSWIKFYDYSLEKKYIVCEWSAPDNSWCSTFDERLSWKLNEDVNGGI